MTNDQQWLETVRREFESGINYRGTLNYSNGQYTDNRLHQKWVGYLARAKKDRAEIERLRKFCAEFVYGEENPQYYKTMDEKIEKRDKLLEKAEQLLRFSVVNFDLHKEEDNWFKEYQEVLK